MPVIRIPDSVFERLQKHATPFVDTPATVIERLLDAVESKQSSSAMPLTNEVIHRYLLALRGQMLDPNKPMMKIIEVGATWVELTPNKGSSIPRVYFNEIIKADEIIRACRENGKDAKQDDFRKPGVPGGIGHSYYAPLLAKHIRGAQSECQEAETSSTTQFDHETPPDALEAREESPVTAEGKPVPEAWLKIVHFLFVQKAFDEKTAVSKQTCMKQGNCGKHGYGELEETAPQLVESCKPQGQRGWSFYLTPEGRKLASKG
jgi:hypothetical protein